MRSTAEDHWVSWWCNPWQWAHPAWRSRFAEGCGLSVSDCDALMTSRHGLFLQAMGIEPTQPPAPTEVLSRWLALTVSQQDHALDLARRVCFAKEAEGADGQWCQGLAKALRPAMWLQPDSQDERLLLGAWLGPDYWPRVRLFWAPGEVAESLCDVPQNKLQTLWQAILWRITAA
ncbi:hypothetical protein [Pseudomonas cannabina]|nr:hypothetical protein [Pseudomonas cannabina]KAA8712118.1 type III secretion protein [Pseudomonas cannabina]